MDVCQICAELKAKRDTIKTSKQKAPIHVALKIHREQQSVKRQKLAKHRKKCLAKKDQYLGLVIDGMDQKKTLIPHFLRPPKNLNEENFVQLHVVGALIFNGVMISRVFTNFPNLHNDPNLTVTVIQKILTEWEGALPSTLYVQLDNTARENKNQVLMAYLSMLVEKKAQHSSSTVDQSLIMAYGMGSIADEENKIEDEGDMSQATQQVLPTIDEETPFHKGDAMSTQEDVAHESDFVAQKPSNDMNKGSENMLPTIGETQIHEGNTRNSEEKMVVVENQSDVQTSLKPSDDMIIKDTYSMPLRDEEVEGSEIRMKPMKSIKVSLQLRRYKTKLTKGQEKLHGMQTKPKVFREGCKGLKVERLRREEEEEERKILEHLRWEEEEEERKIQEHLRRQEKEEAQKKEEPAVHYKCSRRCKYLDPYFMDEL
ncbi:hypothetical protein L7F22_049839 [Adiantum nelumboides]|nr:hypothetical protein [Adiantum nelumboides]